MRLLTNCTRGGYGNGTYIALCGLFNQDDVLNYSIGFTGSEQTMRSISVDERTTIANMTTALGALSRCVITFRTILWQTLPY